MSTKTNKFTSPLFNPIFYNKCEVKKEGLDILHVKNMKGLNLTFKRRLSDWRAQIIITASLKEDENNKAVIWSSEATPEAIALWRELDALANDQAVDNANLIEEIVFRTIGSN